MQFEQLLQQINLVHDSAQAGALRAVNQHLTLRNWLIGYYIVVYEQEGEDRAHYGKKLLNTLAKRLPIKGLSFSALKSSRQFFLAYPQIGQTVSGQFKNLSLTLPPPAAEQTKSAKLQVPAEQLLDRLSFSHFVELMKCDDRLQRTFYEVQAIKNNWSVRKLERAINSLLYERTGLSTDKETVIAKARDEMPLLPADTIRNPYLLEFLGIEEKSAYSESDLEQAIIDHLQHFLIELGRGFCFEARQKRITFDNSHYFIDLVFYHRILKCHVLVDLKLGAFDHADAGQMNVYLNYYRENEMTEGDNPPVGLILCASKQDSLVRYALGGLPHEVFVAKYLVELPAQEKLEAFIRQEMAHLET
ncbi:MAG: YhcG family protein [Candidatus Sericytochromatia bacterium]